MKLAAAVLTGDSVLNSVLTAVNRVLKEIGYNCSSDCLLYDDHVCMSGHVLFMYDIILCVCMYIPRFQGHVRGGVHADTSSLK